MTMASHKHNATNKHIQQKFLNLDAHTNHLNLLLAKLIVIYVVFIACCRLYGARIHQANYSTSNTRKICKIFNEIREPQTAFVYRQRGGCLQTTQTAQK